MRHQKKNATLDRNSANRRSLFANLAESLILHEKIQTTSAKAKALRPVVEKLISKAKANTLAARREIMRVVYTQAAVKKLMEVIAPRYSERAGGFTRIIKTGNRKG